MPFTMTGRSLNERSHARSGQASDVSNCEFTKSDRVTAVPPPGVLPPVTLAKVIGPPRTNAHVHAGWRMPSTMVPSPMVGGRVKPRRTSRSRRPNTAVSTVTMSAS